MRTQELVTRERDVLDVRATLAARSRVLGSNRLNNTDPDKTTLVPTLRTRSLLPPFGPPGLRQVVPADHAEVLRLLSKRNWDQGRERARVIGRLHTLHREVG